MRKLYFALFLCVTVFSCSVDDVTPKLEMEEVKYTSMTKHEFILLLSGKCSDFEIEFLIALLGVVQFIQFKRALNMGSGR